MFRNNSSAADARLELPQLALRPIQTDRIADQNGGGRGKFVTNGLSWVN